jgi:hypothetical protein
MSDRHRLVHCPAPCGPLPRPLRSPYFPNLHTLGLELHKRTVGDQAHAQLMASCSWQVDPTNQAGTPANTGGAQPGTESQQQQQQELHKNSAGGSSVLAL